MYFEVKCRNSNCYFKSPRGWIKIQGDLEWFGILGMPWHRGADRLQKAWPSFYGTFITLNSRKFRKHNGQHYPTVSIFQPPSPGMSYYSLAIYNKRGPALTAECICVTSVKHTSLRCGHAGIAGQAWKLQLLFTFYSQYFKVISQIIMSQIIFLF